MEKNRTVDRSVMDKSGLMSDPWRHVHWLDLMTCPGVECDTCGGKSLSLRAFGLIGRMSDKDFTWSETPKLLARIKALETMLTREREALDEGRTHRDAWKQQATALWPAPPMRQTCWLWSRS